MTGPSRNSGRRRADLIIDELVRRGVDTFFIAPGSRSTPLVTAVADHPQAQPVVHFDERGNAFAAVGVGRATGRPAAVITTSGTAVANTMPAVVEASMSSVPLILLTADRPPDLRDTGSNQTIDQVKLFGDYVRLFADVPADASYSPKALQSTVGRALRLAVGANPGPVHLNCMFREPLEPHTADVSQSSTGEAGGPQPGDARARHTATKVLKCVPEGQLDAIVARLAAAERGLILAGATDDLLESKAVLEAAQVLGWPVLPDICSQLRTTSDDAIAHYFDLMLASGDFKTRNQPDVILHVGGRVTSKRLLTYLESVSPDVYVHVQSNSAPVDPVHVVTDFVECDASWFCDNLASRWNVSASASGWSDRWTDASRKVEMAVQGILDQLSEPRVARILSESVPVDWGLFLGNSMPVRDMDTFAAAGSGPLQVASNRGASGIDGNIATTVGFARGLSAPVVCVVGDLALLHDLNSLALAAKSAVPVVIVAVNNDGGGIFSFLPISDYGDVFERFFSTPHGYSFESAARQFGISYSHPANVEAFQEALGRGFEGGETTLIEVRTKRDENYDVHSEVLNAVRAALAE